MVLVRNGQETAKATRAREAPAGREVGRGGSFRVMSGGNYMFVMVAEGDTPIYEAEFLNTQRVPRPHQSAAQWA